MTDGGREQAAGAVAAPAVVTGNLRAIGAMLLATIVFTIGDAAMKQVAGHMPTSQTVCLRSSLSVLLVAVAAFHTGALAQLRAALSPMMAWRSIGDAGNSLCFQAALPRLLFADIMGILQLTPLSLTAASAIFLGAPVGWRRWCAVAAGLVGALLVIKPGSGAFNAWALLAVLSVLFGTLRDIATRRLDGGISPLVILMLSQSAVALAALCGVFFEPWAWPGGRQMLLVVLAAVCTLLGHFWMIASLRMGDIAAVAPFRYAGIVWAILLGLLLWGEMPDLASLAGMAILVAAGLYAFHRERRIARSRSFSPKEDRMLLQDKIALVTGAGQGIGEATALALSEAGATVVVADIDTAAAERTVQKIASFQRRALSVTADAGDVAQIQRMTDRVMSEYGRIDILVNNAGVTRRADIMEITEADWDRIHRVNAKGVFFCLQTVARTMIPRQEGRIINIASIAGKGYAGTCR